MSETVESQFTVRDIVNDDIWLKDLNRGLTVAVEATSPHYTAEIRQKISDLSTGDTITAELESQNQLRTIWVFDDVEVETEGTAHRATV
ncbi:hypothetical protein [Natrinema salifodinae]|uniref:Uncharacterized protein n=1 Tax=Natrinema salifodinae TaxID=1202768 RepID=A0A1I0NDK1_9EURY|nr:hypothetical protein [Natrinema salifodinae]SEV99363.1 hypothetical protein SAMN05216285_1612 [Natrinema salifodinae]